GHDSRGVRRVSRAVSSVRQSGSPHPAARELDTEWSRRVRSPATAARASAAGRGRAPSRVVPPGTHRRNRQEPPQRLGPHSRPSSEGGAGLFGYLPQDALLFSGSLRENLTLAAAGEAHHDRLLMRAVRLADLEEDVLGFPNGLGTEVGELGVRVSGGQRQRIALARAIAAAAPGLPGLLVLDDPFSAVDVGTEARIVAALKAAFGTEAPERDRVTVIVCSHRLAAFPHADLVVVLQDGRIAASGTHAELLARSALY